MCKVCVLVFTTVYAITITITINSVSVIITIIIIIRSGPAHALPELDAAGLFLPRGPQARR